MYNINTEDNDLDFCWSLIEIRQPRSFNWDVSCMDNGLDAALNDSEGMKYLAIKSFVIFSSVG